MTVAARAIKGNASISLDRSAEVCHKSICDHVWPDRAFCSPRCELLLAVQTQKRRRATQAAVIGTWQYI